MASGCPSRRSRAALGKWDGVPEWQWFLKQSVFTPLSFTLLLTTHPRLASQSLQCSRSTFEPAPDFWGVTVFTAIYLRCIIQLALLEPFTLEPPRRDSAIKAKQSHRCIPGEPKIYNHNTPYSKPERNSANSDTSLHRNVTIIPPRSPHSRLPKRRLVAPSNHRHRILDHASPSLRPPHRHLSKAIRAQALQRDGQRRRQPG
jgi:hypothetical protein